MLRRALLALAGLIALLAVLVLGAFGLANTDWGRERIAALIGEATAGGPVAVRVGAIDGRLPDRIVLRDLTLGDGDGAFAHADRLAIEWRVLDLLAGRIAVDAVEVSGARLDRAPVLPDEPDATEAAPPEPLSLKFDMPPVAVSVDRLSVAALTLGSDLTGERVEVTADLSAALTAREVLARGWIEAVRASGPPARAEIDVALIPASGVLRADLAIREPEGGLLADLLQVEGRPALALSLTGEGGLDHWRGALEGGFGADARLDLDLVLGSDASGYALGIDGSAALARLAPADARPLLEAAAALRLAAALGHDGVLRVDELTVSLPALTLAAKAVIDAEGVPRSAEAELTVPDLAAFSDLAGTALGGDAAVSARLDGDGRRLSVDLTGRPAAAGAALDGLALGLRAEADEALASLPPQIRVALDGAVKTPAVDGVDAVALLGPEVTLAASGTVAPDGPAAVVESLTLRGDGLDIDGRFDLSGDRLSPSLVLTVADLSRLRALAGIELSGAARVAVDGTVDLDPVAVTAAVEVAGSDLGLGDPALEAAVGPSPVLIGGLNLDASQVLELLGLELRTTAAQAGGDLSLALSSGELGGTVTLRADDLARLTPVAGTDLSGAAAVALSLGGTLEAPAASASWRVTDLVAGGTAVDGLTGSATAAGLPDRPAGGVRARAVLRGEPVDLAFGYAMDGDRLRVGQLSLDGLGATLAGEAELDLASTLARGDLTVRAADLGILGTVLDLPLSEGGLEGRIRLTDAGGQGVEATLDLSGLALDDGTTVEAVSLRAGLRDLTGAMAGRVDLDVSGAAAGGARLDMVALAADIAGGAARVSLEASGEAGHPVTVNAVLSVPLDPASAPVVVDALEGAFGDVTVRQVRALEIATGPALRISGIDLAVEEGRIAGRVGLDPAALDIALTVRDLPASLARIADPSLALEGTVAGEIAVSGPLENPTARIALATGGVRTLDPDLADVPPLVATLNGDLADRRASVALNASIGPGATASVSGRVDGRAGAAGAPPLFDTDAALQAAVDADLDLARISAFLPIDLVALAGTGQVRVTAGGTLGDPALAGTVTVEEGQFDLPSAGLYLHKIDLRAEGEGQELVIRTFEAEAKGGGSLSASGTLSADPETGFPAEVTVTARQFNAVDLDLASLSVDLDLAVSGALPEYLLAGTVTVLPTEIRIPDSLPPSVVEIEVVEVRDGRVVPREEEQAEPEEAPDAPLRLDLEIDIPGQVFVRGRGLDSEWGGGLTVTGLADAPVVDGEIAVRRGRLTAVGNTFDFERGRVVFDGGPPENPSLDMRLTTEVTDITAAVVVSGTASAPDIGLQSDPALPEEDILSRLLFGSDKAELTPVQALKLARSAAILSGNFGSGPGVTDQMRDALGVDTLDVDAGTNDDGSVGASLSVGKYIAPGVFLKLQQGLSGATSRAVVEVEVTDSVSVETDVGADSQSRVGVNYELDY